MVLAGICCTPALQLTTATEKLAAMSPMLDTTTVMVPYPLSASKSVACVDMIFPRPTFFTNERDDASRLKVRKVF